MTTSDIYLLRDLIERDFSGDCELAHLGQEVAYSPSSVLRAFRSTWGFTPRQYVEAIRYREAQRMLVETDKSISEICFIVGYQSVPSFVRRFKEVHRVTPTEFRLKQRKFWQGWTRERGQFIPSCMINGRGGFCKPR